jgi:hypothetical protein
MMTAQSIPSAASASSPLQLQHRDLLWIARSKSTVATPLCWNGIKRFERIKITHLPHGWRDRKVNRISPRRYQPLFASYAEQVTENKRADNPVKSADNFQVSAQNGNCFEKPQS